MSIITNSASFGFKGGSIPNMVTNLPVHNWDLFPNPATNELNVRNTTGNSATATYNIIDATGRNVL